MNSNTYKWIKTRVPINTTTKQVCPLTTYNWMDDTFWNFKLKYFPISLTAFSLLGSAAAYRIRTSGSKCLFKVFLSNFPSGSLGEFAHVTPCHGRVTVRGHHMAFDRWSWDQRPGHVTYTNLHASVLGIEHRVHNNRKINSQQDIVSRVDINKLWKHKIYAKKSIQSCHSPFLRSKSCPITRQTHSGITKALVLNKLDAYL